MNNNNINLVELMANEFTGLIVTVIIICLIILVAQFIGLFLKEPKEKTDKELIKENIELSVELKSLYLECKEYKEKLNFRIHECAALEKSNEELRSQALQAKEMAYENEMETMKSENESLRKQAVCDEDFRNEILKKEFNLEQSLREEEFVRVTSENEMLKKQALQSKKQQQEFSTQEPEDAFSEIRNENMGHAEQQHDFDSYQKKGFYQANPNYHQKN